MFELRWTLVPLLAALSLAGCNRRSATEPILLGHLAPLSGPDKAAGEQARQAILLAVEEVNKDENQLAGRRVVVLHVDTRGEVETLSHEAIRLLTVNRVLGLLGGMGVAEVERLGRDVQQYGVPVVTPNGLPTQVATDYLFSVNVAPSYRGQVLARFAAQKWKAARLAVVTDQRSPTATALVAAFGQEWTKLGGTHPEEWTYQNDADLTELAGRFTKMEAGAILFAAPGADLLKLRRQLTEKARQVPLLFAGEESVTALAADPVANEGVYGATVYVAGSDKPPGQEFAKKYEARFHATPGHTAALAYDSARFLFEAIRRARSTTGTKVRDELVRMDNFESVTGPLAMGRDHYAHRAVLVVRLEAGRVQLVQRLEAEGK